MKLNKQDQDGEEIPIMTSDNIYSNISYHYEQKSSNLFSVSSKSFSSFNNLIDPNYYNL